jgi:hypothetical protein
VKPFAAVGTWVGSGVAVYQQMGRQRAATLEGLPALGTLQTELKLFFFSHSISLSAHTVHVLRKLLEKKLDLFFCTKFNLTNYAMTSISLL